MGPTCIQEKRLGASKRSCQPGGAYLWKTSYKIRVVCSLIEIGLIAFFSAFASASTNQSEDLIVFFKQAVNSPPDVEHLRATHQVLQKAMPPGMIEDLKKHGVTPNIGGGPPIEYSGALSGSNFFFILYPSVLEKGLPVKKEAVFGKAGSNTYEIGIASITKTFESAESHPTNPVAQWSSAQHRLMIQLLRMGIGGVKSGTVTWTNSTFVGETASGVRICGELVVSNNLPYCLDLSVEKTGKVYTKLIYEYPTPIDAMNGYPKTITRLKEFGGKWTPGTISSVKEMVLAKSPIPEEYFAETRFLTTNHVSEIIASNGAYFALKADGVAVKFANFSGQKTDKPRSIRVWVLLFLGLTTLAFLIFLARSWIELDTPTIP